MEQSKTIIDVAKSRDITSIRSLIASGADVNYADEQGWTPLNYAAGSGDLEIVRLLVDNGADVFKVGRDNRTPYLIALAAGRVDVVKYLREAEDKADIEKARSLRPPRKYCKAYYLGELRKFPAWSESAIKKDDDELSKFADDKIVYLHEDLSVTESLWHNEDVIFQQITEEWIVFCSTHLDFRIPDDLDLTFPQAGNS